MRMPPSHLWSLLLTASIVVAGCTPVVEPSKTLRHSGSVTSLAFSPSGRWLATADGTVRIWDLKTYEVQRTLTAAPGSEHTVAFSPNGAILATGGEAEGVRVWETATGKLLRTLPTGRYVQALAFSLDGKVLASGDRECGINTWDVKRGAKLRCFQKGVDPTGLAFSPDGKILASTQSGLGLNRWDTATGKDAILPEGTIWPSWERHGTLALNCVAFAPDGKLIATGSDGHCVHLWKLDFMPPTAMLAGHTWRVTGLAFSPDGRLLASVQGGGDAHHPPPGDAKLWDLKSRKEAATFQGHKAGLRCVAFSPDGKLLATGGDDQTVILWNVPGP